MFLRSLQFPSYKLAATPFSGIGTEMGSGRGTLLLSAARISTHTCSGVHFEDFEVGAEGRKSESKLRFENGNGDTRR